MLRTLLFLTTIAWSATALAEAQAPAKDHASDKEKASDKDEISDKDEASENEDDSIEETIRTDAVKPTEPAVQPVTGVEQEEKRRPNVEFVPGKGLQVMSPDRKFRLTTTLFGEVLYGFTHDREQDKNAHSFQLRRIRLIFSGNLFGEHNKFYIQFAFSPRDMGFTEVVTVDENGNEESHWVATQTPIFDFIFQFDYLRDLSVQFGQYRIPYSLQRRVPFANLQFVDRSLANFEFNLDRDVGINIYSKDFLGLNALRYYAGVFIGTGRDGFQAKEFSLLYCARIVVMPLGLFDNHIEADLVRHESPKLSIGTGYAFIDDAKYNQGINGTIPSDGGTTDMHNATADISFKFNGISFFSDFYFRTGERNYGDNVGVPDELARNGIGWNAQLGWLLPKIPFEIQGRYSQTLPIGDQTSLTRWDEVGGGLAWYIFGVSMVLAADYFHEFSNGTLDSGYDYFRIKFQARL